MYLWIIYGIILLILSFIYLIAFYSPNLLQLALLKFLIFIYVYIFSWSPLFSLKYRISIYESIIIHLSISISGHLGYLNLGYIFFLLLIILTWTTYRGFQCKGKKVKNVTIKYKLSIRTGHIIYISLFLWHCQSFYLDYLLKEHKYSYNSILNVLGSIF